MSSFEAYGPAQLESDRSVSERIEELATTLASTDPPADPAPVTMFERRDLGVWIGSRVAYPPRVWSAATGLGVVCVAR